MARKEMSKFNAWKKEPIPVVLQRSVQSVLGMGNNGTTTSTSCSSCAGASCNCGGGCKSECGGE